MEAQQDLKISRFKSLSFKVSFLIALIMLVVLVVFAGGFIISEHQKTTQNIRNNDKVFAVFAAPSIYNYYTQDYTHPSPSDFTNFKEAVQGILAYNPDTTNVSLISLRGRVLFNSSEFSQGKYSGNSFREINDDSILKQVEKDQPATRELHIKGANYREVVVPLQEGVGGPHVVSMRFLMSYDSLAGHMQEVYKRIAITGIILMIFVVGAAIVFSLRLVRPIVALTFVAEKLRGGDFNAQADARSEDEIGRLAKSFNSMVHGLKLSRELIQTQNETLKHEQSRLRASIESLNVGFIMTTVDNEVLMVNRAASDILSYDIGEEGEVKETKLNLKEGSSKIDEVAARLSPAFSLKDKLAMVKRYGMAVEAKEVDYKGRILYVYLGPIMEYSQGAQPVQLGTAILIEDITEEKVLERSKDEFFSIASHELRTPLTAIRGNTSMIEQYFPEQLKDESLRSMIGDIHESSTRLIDIVNDFLDLSRLEQGKVSLKREEFSLEPVIENIVYEMRVVLQEKKLYLKFDKMTLDSLPKVWADKDRTKQVIYNLVGNAAKFTENGGITVSAELQGDRIKVYITDTGRGISLQSQKLLFHKFQQANSSLLTRDTTRGTGLGLYISKMLVDKMGGKVTLEHSVEGQGSTFSFTLPVSTPEVKKLTDLHPPIAQTDSTTGLTAVEPSSNADPMVK